MAQNPEDYNGNELVFVASVFLGLTTFVVLLRFYVRIFITKSFSTDDWLMVVSQAIFTLSCSFILVAVHFGTGRHNKTVSEYREIQAIKYQSLATITYVANMMFIKLSIGVFLLRLAVQKRYIWTLRISMAIISIWSTAIVLYQIFQCKPIEFQWDFNIPGGHCTPGSQFVAAALSISVMTIVSDWLYSIMPIFMIWKVKMSIQKRVTVAIVLSLGIFASVATLIRLKYLAELADYSDALYTGTEAMVWTLIEPGIAIVAASLVTIRPLLHAMHVGGFSSGDATNSHYGRSGYGRSQGLSLRNDVPADGWAASSFSAAQGPNGLKRNEASMDRYKGSSSKSMVVRETQMTADDGSEEYIMEGIRRTVDVRVERDIESRGTDGLGHEQSNYR